MVEIRPSEYCGFGILLTLEGECRLLLYKTNHDEISRLIVSRAAHIQVPPGIKQQYQLKLVLKQLICLGFLFHLHFSSPQIVAAPSSRCL